MRGGNIIRSLTLNILLSRSFFLSGCCTDSKEPCIILAHLKFIATGNEVVGNSQWMETWDISQHMITIHWSPCNHLHQATHQYKMVTVIDQVLRLLGLKCFHVTTFLNEPKRMRRHTHTRTRFFSSFLPIAHTVDLEPVHELRFKPNRMVRHSWSKW